MSADGARGLISMGLEVDEDNDDAPDGTLASGRLNELIAKIDLDTGLVEILRSLARAAEGAADVHQQIDAQSDPDEKDIDLADTCERLNRFAAHINAATKEIWT